MGALHLHLQAEVNTSCHGWYSGAHPWGMLEVEQLEEGLLRL